MKKVNILKIELKPKETVYLKDVKISYTEMTRRQKGYFGYKPTERIANLAFIEKGFVNILDFNGFVSLRKMINAKHFTAGEGLQITEKTFLTKQKALQKAYIAKKESERIESERIAAEKVAYKTKLQNELQPRINEKISEIREFLTNEIINTFFSKKGNFNSLCQKAVGIVGMEFAKVLGFREVLRQINSNL